MPHNHQVRTILSVSMALACCTTVATPITSRLTIRQPPTANSTAVARFDAAVAQGLPARLPLSHPVSPRSRTRDDLHIQARLNGDIVFTDGSHGSTYEATWHGSKAVATRSGNHLDITSVTDGGIEITGFIEGNDEVEHESLGGTRSHGREASTRIATEPSGPIDMTDARNANRLTFHLMLHDDVRTTSSQHIHAGYVAWWLADFQRHIAHGRRVDVLYSQAIAGVTDVRYGQAGALHEWSDAVEQFATEQGIARTFRHKFLLITKGTVEPDRYGRSWQKGEHGMASIDGRYPEIAHQLGHLLGARHEHAEVRYGWWWCETNMWAPSVILRSNCYAYSAPNMSLMDDYIRTGEGHIAQSRWSED